MILSLNLWFPTTRSFPRAPLIIALPDNVVPALEYLLSVLFVFALIGLIFVKHPLKYLIAVIILLIVLVVLDQMRLQPWIYQYLLLLIVMALYYWRTDHQQLSNITLAALQLIVASLYFWGGIQKLNYSFTHEVLPQILASLQNGSMLSQTQISAIGVAGALIETFIGCGLAFKKTRKLAIWLALAMHGLILALLIVQRRNSVVWIWNATLMAMVLVLFWRSDTSVVFSYWRAANASSRLSVILAVLCAVLPVLSFRGWWDMYLSGALYSGNTVIGVVRVDERVYERLPEVAKRQVFAMKNGDQMLPLFEWSMADLNVPPYPEPRVFKQVARAVCKLGGEDTQAELIMKDSPAILDGSYKITRIDCRLL